MKKKLIFCVSFILIIILSSILLYKNKDYIQGNYNKLSETEINQIENQSKIDNKSNLVSIVGNILEKNEDNTYNVALQFSYDKCIKNIYDVTDENNKKSILTGNEELGPNVVVNYGMNKKINYKFEVEMASGFKILKDFELIEKADDYGQYVNIGTNLLGDLNNLTLADQSHPQADWRIFYIDDDEICLILADILPVSKVPSGTGLSLKNGYSVYGSTRGNLLSGLNSDQWNKLIVGTDVENIENVRVKGGVDVIGWCKSWNENINNYIHIYTNGTRVGTTSNLSDVVIYLGNSPGYDNTLYFPHKSIWNGCSQYWLANIHPDNGDAFYDIAWAHQDVNQFIGLDWERYYRTFEGVRPVIFLPANTQFNKTGDVWTIIK